MLKFSKITILTTAILSILVIFLTISNFTSFDDKYLNKKINLGLDLQGGSYLLLKIDNDPVVIKGQCFFTPKSGQAYVSTQIRLAGGESRVWVVCDCNVHGKWAISKDVKVAAGGC